YKVAIYNYWSTQFEQSKANKDKPVYQPLFWRFDVGSYITAPQMLLTWSAVADRDANTEGAVRKLLLMSEEKRKKIEQLLRKRKAQKSKALQKQSVKIDLAFKFANERKYILNAIYSLVTGHGERGALRNSISAVSEKWKRIEGRGNKTTSDRGVPMEMFTRYFSEWQGDNQKQGGYLNGKEYKSTLLNSVFTISPSGNNPETFRLWEAMGHGSIPIFAMDSNYFQNKQCLDAFRPIFAFSQWYHSSTDHSSRDDTVEASFVDYDTVYFDQQFFEPKDATLQVQSVRLLIGKFQNLIRTKATWREKRSVQEEMMDQIELLLDSDHVIYPFIILRNWNELDTFLDQALTIRWEWFQLQTILWWHRFVQFKFDQMLHKLFDSAPFCRFQLSPH
ncbi:hypothetical protein RFI_15566, partial [Reticulomyxa filosa]